MPLPDFPVVARIQTSESSPGATADAALRQIQAKARYVFTPEEYAVLTGRAPGGAALKMALQRLARQGRITLATKRPVNWLIVPAEHSHYGAPPVDWWLDSCLKQTEPNYYVALLSAARHWGSSHYAVQSTQVMVGKPRHALTVGRLRVDFFTKRDLADTPTVIVRDTVAPWRVSTREATLLDLVRHQTSVGGLEAIVRVANDLSVELNAASMTQALNALDQVPAAQRIGFVLDRIGAAKAAKAVARWLSARRPQTQPLEPQRSAHRSTPRIDPSWNIAFDADQLAVIEELK